MFDTIPKATALLSIAGLLALALAGQAHAGRDCGGLNQKSCWHVDPNKWCDGNLQYKPTGVPGKGTCVKREPKKACGGLNETTCISVNPAKWCDAGLVQVRQSGRNICVRDEMGVDTSRGCGGEGEKSCWSMRPSQWCDAGLIYKPGGVPGRGRCEAADEGNMIQLTRAAASRMKSLGSENEFTKLRNCLIAPSRFARLKEEMKANDTNGTNSIIRECNVDVEKLQDVAAYVLGDSNFSGTRSKGARTTSSSQDWDDDLNRKLRFTLELSVDASFFNSSAGGAIGYAIPMHEKPLGARWYKGSDDFAGGVDVGIGADLLIGIGFPGVPGGDYAVENGVSGVVAGALGAKVAATLRGDTDNGGMMFAVFGGAGLGVTAAIYEYQNEFFKDK
jgi:hypothetical protein